MGMASELRNVALKADPKFNDTADNLMKFFIEGYVLTFMLPCACLPCLQNSQSGLVASPVIVLAAD